jgi:hypothetical protein
VVVGTEVAIRVVPARVRRALEALAFVAEWEHTRLRSAGYYDLPLIATDAERWLARYPERDGNRFALPELLVWVGRYDEAEEVVGRMPESTPWERFERAGAADLVDWARGGNGDPAGLRALAAAVGPPSALERVRAEAVVAVRAAQRAAAEGGDTLAPLIEARRHLGSLADPRIGPHFRAQIRRALAIAAIILVPYAYYIRALVTALTEARPTDGDFMAVVATLVEIARPG